MRKILWGLILMIGGYLFFFETQQLGANKEAPLKVHFLDVGQGDAILIDYLGTYQVLIDGGPSGEKLLKRLGETMPWGDKKIELVLLTHPDKDHLVGFLDLIDNFQIDLFLTNGQKTNSQNFLVLEEKIKTKNIPTKAVYAGAAWQIGQYLKFSVLNPDEENSQDSQEKNDQSVIVRMDFGENSFFLAADAEKETEGDLLTDGEVGDIDWLKVAHHGSKNATTEEFLISAKPEKAIISVGKNSYGHPTEETLERLAEVGAEIFRTDQLGTVSIFCSSPQKNCWKKE